VNYVLWKIYGMRGTELAAFLGGLVNSRIAIGELAAHVHETQGETADITYRGILLAIAAMLIRNALVLGILAPAALISASITFVSMLAVCAIFVLLGFKHRMVLMTTGGTRFPLKLPFSLWITLKYGALFVCIQIIGNLAQQAAGQGAFYLISFLGGLASSASSLAAAANLTANGTISSETAGVAAIIATVTSVLVNLPFVLRSRHKLLTTRLVVAMVSIAAVGILGALVGPTLLLGRVTYFLSSFE
jgi:uncharacterized membrane protein (DUF4010 family)